MASREARVIACAAVVLGIAATLAFALGRDDWKRSLREPTADAAYYYAYLPSLVLDGDLDLADEYQVTKNWYRLGPTPTGRPGNVFGIGPAVFSIPAFVVGHGLARIAGARTDGFSRWETTLVLWLAIPCSLGALLLAYRLARRRVGAAGPAFAGALAAALAGPLVYYAIRQPGYAHPFAALFATWLIERWDASYDEGPRSTRTWLVLGALAGAAALARPQLAVWALLLPAAAIDDLRRRADVPVARLAARWALGAAAALVAFAPQLVAWRLLYGAWYVVPQGAGFMRWDAPAWSETLFASRNGLFPWSPLYAPMLLGVVALARDGVRLPLALLLGLFGQALVNGAAWDWWAGGSFGGRRFDSSYVVFAVGAAVWVAAAMRAVSRARASRSWAARVAAGLACAGLAAGALVAGASVELAAKTSVNSARIGGGEPASRVWRARIGGLRGRLAAWLSAASNAPARAAFAWRHGVDRTAYDRLVGVHVLGETYPGLNSYPDKRRDVSPVALPPPHTAGLAALPDGRARVVAPGARVRFGVNRRGVVTLRVPVEAAGTVRLRWDGVAAIEREVAGPTVLELAGQPRRGVNTLLVDAPIGAVVSAIELSAEPVP